MTTDGTGDPLIGMVGGSYGGVQALVAATIDPRIDAIVPAIAPHTLTTAIYPEKAFDFLWGGALLPAAVLGAGDRVNPQVYIGAITGTLGGWISPKLQGLLERTGPGERVGMREKPGTKARLPKKADAAATDQPTPADDASGTPPGSEGTAGSDLGLPAELLAARDLRAAVKAFLLPAGKPSAAQGDASGEGSPEGDQVAARASAGKLARLRISAVELGNTGRFDRAAELISAAVNCGQSEPWMYEALAVAMEAAGKPKTEVERALMSSADFATSPNDLLSLAQCLARFGSSRQAIRLCRQVATIEPSNREAFALAMTIASKENDLQALKWACAGVLSNEWPAGQQDLATRAARLAKAAISGLEKQAKVDDAEAFRTAVDEALVRDVEIEFSWNGDADIDMVVEEPAGTVCSLAMPRTTSGGTLLADTDLPADPTNATQRERYIAGEAFPGTYRILIHRAYGKVTADTVTVQLTLHRGTEREQKIRRQVPIGADDTMFTIDLPEGRRRQPLFEAQVSQDVALQQSVGKAILAQQLRGMSDSAAADSLAHSRGITGNPSTTAPFLPFNRGGATGYQPVITSLQEGTNMSGTAVVSADRRYVRVEARPFFSGIGAVYTFNFS
ncbi:MAG: hypothetical protein WCH79_19745, partial [Planctomycetia bacterium]